MRFSLALIMIGLLASNPASATLLVQLEGTPGSSVISLSASGSNLVTNGIITGSLMFNPAGDILGPGSASGNVSLIGSNIEMTDGSSSTLFDLLYITQSTDQIFLNGSPAVLYSVGETVSISGTATADLTPLGLSFEDFNPGSFSRVDSGLGPITLKISSVPSPSPLLLVGSITGLLFLQRRGGANSLM